MTEYITSTKYSIYQPKNVPYNIIKLKQLIFPPISNDKLNKLMIDNESIRYITFTQSAYEITNVVMNNLYDFPCPDPAKLRQWNTVTFDKKMEELVITDMTAGVGGNVLNFANYFKYVNA